MIDACREAFCVARSAHPSRLDGRERSDRMNIHRLEPITFDPSSWQYSQEKSGVWASAPTPKATRDLVAVKSAFATFGVTGLKSPWPDEAFTYCP